MFKTIASKGFGSYKEKGSKFLGYAYPCTSKTEVKSHLERLRKENPGVFMFVMPIAWAAKKTITAIAMMANLPTVLGLRFMAK